MSASILNQRSLAFVGNPTPSSAKIIQQLTIEKNTVTPFPTDLEFLLTPLDQNCPFMLIICEVVDNESAEQCLNILIEKKKNLILGSVPLIVFKNEHVNSFMDSKFLGLNAIDVIDLSKNAELAVAKINAILTQQISRDYKQSTLLQGSLTEYPIEDLVSKADELSLNGFIYVFIEEAGHYYLCAVHGEITEGFFKDLNAETHAKEITDLMDDIQLKKKGIFLMRTGFLESYSDIPQLESSSAEDLTMYQEMYSQLGELISETSDIEQVYIFDQSNHLIYHSVPEHVIPYVYPAISTIYNKQFQNLKENDEHIILHATDREYFHIYKHLDIIIIALTSRVFQKEELSDLLINV